MEPPTTKFIQDALTDACDLQHPATTVVLARRLLEVDPEDGITWLCLGYALGWLANYDEAEVAFQNALKNSRESIHYVVYDDMGHACRQRGDYEGAARCYRMAIGLKPDEAASYIFLGRVLREQGKLAEAEDVNRSATMCSEGPIDEAHYSLGYALRCQGRLAEACKCFEKAIELDPKYDVAKEALADVRAAIDYQKSFE